MHNTPIEVATVEEVPAGAGPLVCAVCGGAVDLTRSLMYRVRPGRRTKIWHPACPTATDTGAAS